MDSVSIASSAFVAVVVAVGRGCWMEHLVGNLVVSTAVDSVCAGSKTFFVVVGKGLRDHSGCDQVMLAIKFALLAYMGDLGKIYIIFLNVN